MRRNGFVFAAVVLAQALGAAAAFGQPSSPAPAAGTQAIDPGFACATVMTATAVDGDPNSAVVHVVDPPGPTAGTITAYGTDQAWSGTIGRAVLTTIYGAQDSSLVVRAPGPIQGIEYAPPWAPCTLKAGVYPRPRFAKPDQVQRPVLELGDARPVEPVTCARPYVEPTTLHASEPMTPQEYVSGNVRVRVALDENGTPLSGRVITSPSRILNAVSISAAMQSRYAPAVFRCARVATGYDFSIQFLE